MNGNISEAETRAQLIDQQLAQAGWTGGKATLVEELLLAHWGGTRAVRESSSNFVDYALLNGDGQPIAIVEAKRTCRDEIAGKRQASDYADLIKAQYGIEPFIFLTNGLKTWFWDRDLYAPREVSGFFTPEDLANLQFIRRYRKPLSALAPNPKIAGRDYQTEAIKRITERLAAGHRKFLMVMATGTGKTRTAVALVDVLMRAKWIQRVLFLVDRVSLPSRPPMRSKSIYRTRPHIGSKPVLWMMICIFTSPPTPA